MRRARCVGLLLLAGASAARAQTPPGGDATVDSAQVARVAWREGQAALGRGELDSAWRAVSRASHAWPEQPVYARGMAVLAARRRDTTALLQALSRLAAMEAADHPLDSAIATMARGLTVRRALTELRMAAAPRRWSEVWATSPDTMVFAEGIDADPKTGRAFVASVRRRTVFVVAPGTEVRDLGLHHSAEVSAVLGVRFDPRRRTLWVTTSGLPYAEGYQAGDSVVAGLLRVDPESGEILARYDAPGLEPRVLGDLAVGPRGDVLVTDSRQPVVLRLRPGRDSLEGFRHPLFRSLQGVAFSPRDEAIVYLADWSHGLLRWDTRRGEVERLPAPAGITSLGLDGIVMRGDAIIGIQNGVAPPRVVRLDLDRAGRRIVSIQVIDRNLPLADEPTIATLLGDRLLYVANSQWNKYQEDGTRRPGTSLGPTVLLSLPLGSAAGPPSRPEVRNGWESLTRTGTAYTEVPAHGPPTGGVQIDAPGPGVPPGATECATWR